MARKRVTMQDIADACGLSRNTVSKIFNGRGTVSEATRKKIIKAAQELGYFQFLEEKTSKPGTHSQNIALLTHSKPMNHNFGSSFIINFTNQLCRAGYTLKMYEISTEELTQKKLPPHLMLENTVGILGIELFDRDYLHMICGLGLPTIFVDGYAHVNSSLLCCDLISMENIASIIALTERLIASGAKRIGFVGDINHCNSFYERWIGFCTALGSAGLPLDHSLCILAKDEEPYGDVDWLFARLEEMPSIPDAFVCANDFLAIHLMAALKKKGLSIPADVMVTGFDGSPESAVVEPPLTTVQIPSADIGRLAADILLDRIQNPDRPFRFTYVKTIPVWRDSIR